MNKIRTLIAALLLTIASAVAPATAHADTECMPTITQTAAHRATVEFDGTLTECLAAWSTLGDDVAQQLTEVVILRYRYDDVTNHSIVIVRI